MLMIDGGRHLVGDMAGELARLEALVADLERLGNGWFPTAQELGTAPLIDPFIVTSRPALCLVGGNVGHPTKRAPAIRTSDLQIIAPELGWARTASRFYRLGVPLHPGQQPSWSAGVLP